MIPLWLVTVVLGLLVLLVVWRCTRHDSKDKRSSTSTQQSENFIRCHGALQELLSTVIPSLQRTIDLWHQTTAQNISQCTCIPPNHPSYKKPKHSCQGFTWVKAIESATYPPSAKGSLQWRNANSALFHQDPLEVMKLFVLRIPDVNQTYSTLGDFDAASVLMIMSKFAPFQGGNQAVYDQVTKVKKPADI